MIALFVVEFLAVSISLGLYLKFSPSDTRLRDRMGFEIVVLCTALAGSLGVTHHSYATIGQSVDSAWWPIVGVFYCSVLVPVVLLLAALIRRVIYRTTSPPNGELESVDPSPGPNPPQEGQ